MGTDDEESPENERPAHTTRVKTFYLGRFEITQTQYKALMGTNPSTFLGPNLPVDNVSWYRARLFCETLARATGRKYRLPTEAEWEYAARAGTRTRFGFGDDVADLSRYAWYNEQLDLSLSDNPTTHPVGQKLPNGFGLHDIHGNAYEWCEDIWNENYLGAPADGSAWMSGASDEHHVFRGGGAYSAGLSCCSTSRHQFLDSVAGMSIFPYVGFRLACSSGVVGPVGLE